MREALPSPIQRQLGALRGRLLRVSLFTGVVYIAAGLVGYLFATFALDRTLELPWLFRAILLGAGGLAILWLLFAHLLAPVKRAASLSDDEAALWVERHFDLDEELISAVQLSREGPGALAEERSSALVSRVIEEASLKVKGLRVGRAVSGARLARSFLFTVVAGCIAWAAWQRAPELFRIWWERNVLLAETLWPREVELAVTYEPEAGVVAIGERIAVRAEVVRGDPRKVFVEAEPEGEGEPQRIPLTRVRDAWRGAVENLDAPQRVRVVGGDYVSPWFRVDVRPRPAIESIAVWVRYPRYTGLEDTPEDAPQPDGNVRVPQGAEVRFRLATNQDIARATLSVEPPGALEAVGPLEASGRRVRGAFRVLRDAQYGFALVSTDDFASDRAARFHVDAVPDRLPDVRFEAPGKNRDVTPTAVIPLVIALSDDYRLTGASLVHTLTQAGAREQGPEQRAVLELPDGTTSEAKIERPFYLRETGAAPGDRVTYWAEAVDTRAPTGDVDATAPESRGRSRQSYTFRVVEPAELQRALEVRLKRVRGDLSTARRAQASLRDELARLEEAVAQGELAADARRKLAYGEMDQRRLLKPLERARDEFEAVRHEMVWNDVAKDDDVRWLAQLEATASEAVAGPAAEATSLLGQLRQRPERETLARALRRQDDVLEAIDSLVRRLDKWDEINEVVRELQNLLRAQESLQERTRARAKKDVGGD